MDTPSRLKESAIPGLVWDVEGRPLLSTLTVLEGNDGVLLTGLIGDHLRAITPFDVDASGLMRVLVETGIKDVEVRQVEPTLEDVFLSLAA